MPKVIFWAIRIASLVNLGLGIIIKTKRLKEGNKNVKNYNSCREIRK